MEYVEGAPLKGPLPVEKAVEYAGQILDALDDARSDLFSFGCMLYEMLTGARAFGGASAASMIAAILEREAPSVATVAPQLERIVRRCLAKDPFLRHTIVSLSLQTSTPDENNGGPKWTCHPQSPRQSREVQKEM